MMNFDLICLGGGSGGIACANKAASLGAKVAVIENQKLGGTCVNLGCVPKKIMWSAADLLHRAHHDMPAYSINAQNVRANWESLVKKRQAYIKNLNALYAKKLETNKVTLIRGFGSFVDKNTISVNGKRYTAKHIVIATGSKPLMPDVTGAELGLSSDDFFAFTSLPKHVAVVGSGYIGVELACLLNNFAVKVSLIVRGERVLRHFDECLGYELMDLMRQQGIDIHCHHKGSAIIKQGEKLEIHCVDDTPIICVDEVIWAIGRSPNTHGINCEAINLNLDKQGYIVTDELQNANIKNIYALGDVSGRIQLTPVAIAAGRRLAIRLFGDDPNAHLDYNLVPTVIFTHPPVASIGLSTHEAQEKFGKENIKLYQTKFNPMYYAFNDADSKIPTVMKLITEGPDEKIVGCHMLGQNVDEILQGFSVAIKMGATKKDFDNTVAIHPTSAEELVTLT